AGATDRCHDVVSRPHLRHVRSDGLDLPKALVPDDQEIESRRRSAVLGRIDLLVRPVDTHAENLDQDAATSWDLVHGWLRKIREVDALRFAGKDCDCLHGRRPPVSELVPGLLDRSSPPRKSSRRCLTSCGIPDRFTLAAISVARLYVARYARQGAHTRK